MPAARESRRMDLGGRGLAVVAGLGLALGGCDQAERLTTSKAIPVKPPAATAAPAAPAAPLGFAGLERGEAKAAEEFFAAVRAENKDLEQALPADLLAWVPAARAGFEKLDPVHRAQVVSATTGLVVRLANDPAPEGWAETLNPAAEIYTLAMGDGSPAVRVGAAEAVGHLWVWQPAAALAADQERALGAWKERLYSPLVSLLKDAEPGVRVTAVKALGKLPLDGSAAPAVALISDEHMAVRLQVITSFAARREVLPEEDLLPRLYDKDGAIAMAALTVLKARGLGDEQIELGRLIFHPEPAQRLAAIPELLGRADIDPVTWLLQLSFDREESVRVAAMKALSERTSPEALKRVTEMSRDDPSELVRREASELLPRMTAGLFPLPGTKIPSPTAN